MPPERETWYLWGEALQIGRWPRERGGFMRIRVRCPQGREEEAVDVAESWAFARQCLPWYLRAWPYYRWILCSPPGISVQFAILDGDDDLQVKVTP